MKTIVLLFFCLIGLSSFVNCGGELGSNLAGYWVSPENPNNWAWFLSNGSFFGIAQDTGFRSGFYQVPQENWLDIKIREFGNFAVPFLYKVEQSSLTQRKLTLASPIMAPGQIPGRPANFDNGKILYSAELPKNGPPGFPSGPPPPPLPPINSSTFDIDLVGSWTNETIRTTIDFHPNQDFFARAKDFQLQGKWSANKSGNALNLTLTSPIPMRIPALYQLIDNNTLRFELPPMNQIFSGVAAPPTSFTEAANYLNRQGSLTSGGPPPQTSGGPPPSSGGPPQTSGGPPPSSGGPPQTSGGPPPSSGGPPQTSAGPPPQTSAGPPPPPPTYTTSIPDHDDQTSSIESTGLVVNPDEDTNDSESDSNTGLIVGLCIAAIAVGILSMALLFGLRRWRDKTAKYQET